ncbi:MAG: PAS domain-containing protein [Anaerolineae bacterium]|nr:PAS domain-containing protein [Anaerolineae bacterium]
MALLKELAGDLAFGIRALRTREALQQSTEALRETNKQLQAVIQASPLAIISLTLDGQVATWNQAAERIFGWAEAEVVGRTLPIVPPDRQDEFRVLLERVRRGEALAELELIRQRKDGTPLEVSVSTAPSLRREWGPSRASWPSSPTSPPASRSSEPSASSAPWSRR